MKYIVLFRSEGSRQIDREARIFSIIGLIAMAIVVYISHA